MTPSVLVVEDDSFIRTCTAEMIGECGFPVIEAETADQAIQIITDAADEIAAIVTDVRMPGELDGIELAKIVNSRWPNIRVLVTSGYAGNRRQELPDNVRFLAKPWRALDIITYVMES